MLLTHAQRSFLERGLMQTAANADKWKVVLTIVIPHIIGEKLFADWISPRDGTPQKSEYEIKEVVIGRNQIVLAHEEFWEKNQYRGNSLCHVREFTYSFTDSRPMLDGDGLIFGMVPGYGDHQFYLPLELALEQ